MYVLLNPHISDLASEPLAFRFVRRKGLRKYFYLINEAIARYGTVDILVDAGASGLVPMSVYIKLPFFIRKLVAKIEIHYWKKTNKIDSRAVIHYSPATITNKSKLLSFAYKNYYNAASLVKTCNNFSCNIFHLSHYHSDTKLLSATLKQVNNIYLAADTDISNAVLFRHFFKWYDRIIILFSFDVADRFKCINPVAGRKAMAVATGTFHYIKETAVDRTNKVIADFYSSTGATALHPLRRELYEKKEQYTNEISCLCSPYIEKKQSIFTLLLPTKIFAAQKKYFSFNIVDKYNDYRFAIVGEEFYNGLPGIGAFEAMACGCVLLAYPECYKGLGIVDGVHFIAHNNNTDDIAVMVNQKKNNLAMLEIISANAALWVKENMQASKVFDRLITQLAKLP